MIEFAAPVSGNTALSSVLPSALTVALVGAMPACSNHFGDAMKLVLKLASSTFDWNALAPRVMSRVGLNWTSIAPPTRWRVCSNRLSPMRLGANTPLRLVVGAEVPLMTVVLPGAKAPPLMAQ